MSICTTNKPTRTDWTVLNWMFHAVVVLGTKWIAKPNCSAMFYYRHPTPAWHAVKHWREENIIITSHLINSIYCTISSLFALLEQKLFVMRPFHVALRRWAWHAQEKSVVLSQLLWNHQDQKRRINYLTWVCGSQGELRATFVSNDPCFVCLRLAASVSVCIDVTSAAVLFQQKPSFLLFPHLFSRIAVHKWKSDKGETAFVPSPFWSPILSKTNVQTWRWTVRWQNLQCKFPQSRTASTLCLHQLFLSQTRTHKTWPERKRKHWKKKELLYLLSFAFSHSAVVLSSFCVKSTEGRGSFLWVSVNNESYIC